MQKRRPHDSVEHAAGQNRQLPEIFIGLVGAVGTDLLDLVTKALKDALQNVGYGSQPIRLSEGLEYISYNLRHKMPTDFDSAPEDIRIETLMDLGDLFREKMADNSAVAVLAIKEVEKARMKRGAFCRPIHSHAYIFRSLKRPEEVEALRKIYRERFILISAYSPSQLRLQKLTNDIAYTHHDLTTDQYKERAQHLIHRDQFDYVNKQWGQKVRNTFDKADLFVDASIPDRLKLKREFIRFFELYFGNIFQTPTKDEHGMFHAYASAARSSSASRRVGAVIMTEDGDIMAAGANEVPKRGGGLYGSDDQLDYRDFKVGYETNDRKIGVLIGDILRKLERKGYLKLEHNTLERFIKNVLSGDLVRQFQLSDVIEFGRPVHAEMAALVDASRRTVGVKGCTMYTTTFPCHICAKHIVAAGIKKVVYISPYPKSLAQELFFDSITVDSLQDHDDDRVKFESFVGIAPRRYLDLFYIEPIDDEWKTREGDIREWSVSNMKVRFDETDETYIWRETQATKALGRKISARNIIPIRKKVRIQRTLKK